MELTRKQAFELSIEKWRMIVENNGKDLEEYPPYMAELISNCGLCEKYFEWLEGRHCKKCPIRLNNEGDGCGDGANIFQTWYKNQTKTTAQAVLDLILSKQ
jgi:hypothetical protein